MIVRIVWTLLFLGACVAWVVLSYQPQWLAAVQVTFDTSGSPYFIWLFVGSALLFVSLQAVVLAAVRHFPARVAGGPAEPTTQGSGADETPSEQAGNQMPSPALPGRIKNQAGRAIHLQIGVEYFWTALPLLISIIFFWSIWRSLAG